ncbi:hypothetical protein F5X99DRAFT_409074 [Biscogniauxia marginata]|nr:hypothetical protein F5X99DRAFT_409074 [Biscogniauxia marginata]
MVPLRTRTDDNQRVLLRAPSYSQDDSLTSKSKASTAARKPWADEPWPLIETPSKTQQITHPALHIANEIAHTHNAMLRGLNAIFLQAPHVRQPADVADLMFLTQAWSAWLLDHHELKETAMLPGFEGVLGLEPGALGGARNDDDDDDERRRRSRRKEGNSVGGNEDAGAPEGERDHAQQEQQQPIGTLLQHVYAYATATQADPPSYAPSALRSLLARLASPLVPHLTRQVSFFSRELVLLCSSSTSSSSSSSSPYTPSTSATSPYISAHAHATAAAASADVRANALLRVYLGCAARASDALDRPVAAPMIVGLRDATFEAGRGRDWPRLSVPAVHAIADRLAPRHAGAWRFLPCDVWGRPRELGFLG